MNTQTIKQLSTSTMLHALNGAAFFVAVMALAPQAGHANPTGGVVVGGAADIVQTTDKRLDINQHTDRAIINWQGFSIAGDEHTNFNQPSANSVALNRVVGQDPSQILGRLTANGNIMLVNPNGVFFGKNATVDVGSLVATTADIKNQDFMSGRYVFAQPGNPDAQIVNQGTITVAEGGMAAFVAPGVENSGIIAAKAGKVALAGGDAFTLDMYGDNLINFEVGEATTTARATKAKVSNKGEIYADQGTVFLTARAAREVVDSSINMDGVIEAKTASIDKQGNIILSGDNIQVAGKLDVSGQNGASGGKIKAKANTKMTFTGSAKAESDAAGGNGGFIEISGEELDFNGKVSTKAQNGQTGTVLFDPAALTINGGNVASYQDALDNSNVNLAARNRITLDTDFNTSGQGNANTLNFQDENADANLVVNLNGKITLGASQHLTGDATRVNLANTGLLQNAVDVASAVNGALIDVAPGVYTLNQTLTVRNKPNLDIKGSGQGTGMDGASTFIDASTIASTYGIAVESDGTTLRNFTLQGPNVGGGAGNYGIKIQPNAVAYNYANTINDVTVNNVTVQGSGRSEIDVNSGRNITIKNVTVDGQNTAGNGIALTDTRDSTLRNITTLNNNWGGVAVYATGIHYTGGTDNIEVKGTNSFGEANQLYVQEENGQLVTNLILPEFNYMATNTALTGYRWYQTAEAAAIDFAIGTGANAVLQTLTQGATTTTDNHYIVGTNGVNNMSLYAALAAVQTGGLVDVRAGTYALTAGTLNLSKENVTLAGAGQANTTIDASGINGYGLFVTGNGTTLQDFTLQGPSANIGSAYGIKIQPDPTGYNDGPNNPASAHYHDTVNNITLSNLTVKGSGRTEIDVNAARNLTMTNIMVDGQGTAGNGIALTDTIGADLTNITTLNNNWGGIALYATGRWYAGGTSDINLSGANSYGEANPLYVQEENGNVVTDITVSDFSHLVQNAVNPGATGYRWYQLNENAAINFALTDGRAAVGNNGTVQTLTQGAITTADHHYLVGNNGVSTMSLYAAMAAVQTGGLVDVRAGTYSLAGGTLNVDKADVTLAGAGQADTLLDATGSAGYGMFVTGNGTTLRDFTLANAGTYGIKVQPDPTGYVGGPNSASPHYTDTVNNVTLQNLTVRNSGRSEIDVNSGRNITIDNVTADGNNTAGNGIALTDTIGANLSNITTMNNNWGGIALYGTGTWYQGGTSAIGLTGTNSLADSNPLYVQEENGNTVSDIYIPDFTHVVKNATSAVGYRYYQLSEANASNFALNLANNDQSTINKLVQPAPHTPGVGEYGVGPYTTEGGFLVTGGMSLQTALDNVGDNGEVDLGDGTFNFTTPLIIASNGVTLRGNGRDSTFLTSTGNGIEITGDGAILEAFKIEGLAGGLGILINGDTATMQDLTIGGFDNGIKIDGGKNAVVQNNIMHTTGDSIGVEVNNANGTLVTGNALTGYDNGIKVTDSKNVTIENNTMTGNGFNAGGTGIILKGSDKATVTFNGIEDFETGISVKDSEKANISLAFVRAKNGLVAKNADDLKLNLVAFIGDGTGTGVSLNKADNAKLEYVGAINYDTGFALENSDSFKLQNSLAYATTGLYAANSKLLTAKNNWFIGTGTSSGVGVNLDNAKDAVVKDNRIFNTRTGVKLVDSNGATVNGNNIDAYNGIIAKSSNDLTIAGNEIEGTGVNDGGTAIRVEDSKNVEVKNNVISDIATALRILFSKNVTARNNEADSYDGIVANGSDNLMIADNRFNGTGMSDGGIGISVKNSDNATVTDNRLKYFGTGIELRNSNDATVKDNKVTQSQNGLYARKSHNLLFKNNMLNGGSWQNGGSGITLDSSHDARIKDNEVSRFYNGIVLNGTTTVDSIKGNDFSKGNDAYFIDTTGSLEPGNFRANNTVGQWVDLYNGSTFLGQSFSSIGSDAIGGRGAVMRDGLNGGSGNTAVAGAGTFKENIVLNHIINLLGQGNDSDPAANTILQARSAGANALTINASGASLANPLSIDNMRIVGGSSTGNGIYVNGASNLAFNNLALSGAGNAEAYFAGATNVALNNVLFDSTSALYSLFISGYNGPMESSVPQGGLSSFSLNNVLFSGTPQVGLRIQDVNDMSGLSFNDVMFNITGTGNTALSIGNASGAPLVAGNMVFVRNPGNFEVHADNDVTAGLDFGDSTFTGATSRADILSRFTLDPVSQVPFIILPFFDENDLDTNNINTQTNNRHNLLTSTKNFGAWLNIDDLLNPAAGPGDDNSEKTLLGLPISSNLLAVVQYFINSGWVVNDEEAIRQLLLMAAAE